MLRSAVSAIHDAEHQVHGFAHNASPELRALLAGVNASANIASHIRIEVEKRVQRHLNERHTKKEG